MIAATVLMLVSVIIEAVHAQCGSKAADSQPFVKNCANGESLTGQDNHLDKPLSSPVTSTVQVYPSAKKI